MYLQCISHILDSLYTFANDVNSLLTCTDTSPLVDVSCVVTLQPFTCVTGVHFRAGLSFLTGTHQAAGTVVQDQGHPRETHGGLLRALASPWTRLGPDYCKQLGGKENEFKCFTIHVGESHSL